MEVCARRDLLKELSQNKLPGSDFLKEFLIQGGRRDLLKNDVLREDGWSRKAPSENLMDEKLWPQVCPFPT